MGAAAANMPAPPNALARYGSPEEDVAPDVLFLASRDAQLLTGYSLTPDGGMIIDSARCVHDGERCQPLSPSCTRGHWAARHADAAVQS